MPRYLTEQDISDFRNELCRVATERFARHGYEGVTMRQLAEALGCSPKTPYRYFKDKADILATVRAQAFNRFAEALEKAAAAPGDPTGRGRAVIEAYLDFALRNPHAYRIMFDIDAPIDANHPELGPAADRAARFITSGAERMAELGVIAADPLMFGWSMWAAIHGTVMLHQAAMLKHGPDHREMLVFLADTLVKGAGQVPAKAPRRRKKR